MFRKDDPSSTKEGSENESDKDSIRVWSSYARLTAATLLNNSSPMMMNAETFINPFPQGNVALSLHI
jgi:hypothetical protein